MFEDGSQHVAFVPEAGVDGAGADAGSDGDRSQAHGAVADGVELLGCRLDNLGVEFRVSGAGHGQPRDCATTRRNGYWLFHPSGKRIARLVGDFAASGVRSTSSSAI